MEDWGMLIIRIIIGLLFIGHGTQKLFGWFGGYGLKGTGGWLESIGMKPGVAMALAAGIAETAGGLMFAFGLWMPVAAVLLVATMLVSIVKVHGQNGLWVTQNGYEYNLVLIAIAVGGALIGAGDYSLDAVWFE
jgi:putative oxidoreductase